MLGADSLHTQQVLGTGHIRAGGHGASHTGRGLNVLGSEAPGVGRGVGLLSSPSAAEFWVRPGPELQALHTVFGAQESVAPGRYAPAWRLGTGSLQSDHSRPQGEVVGTSGTRRGAGCELSADQQHLSRRSARARDPAPLCVLTQTPWGPGDRRLWGVARHSRGAPQCQPPTRGDLNATSHPTNSAQGFLFLHIFANTYLLFSL